MKYESITSNKDYTKLYYLLKDNSLSESYISKLRRDSSFIKLNGKNANMRSRVNKGDIVSFALEVGTSAKIQLCNIPIDIVFEDEYLLIVNKPSNLTSVPTKSHYDINLAGAVCNYMKSKTDNFVFRILNRLDKDTAGLVIIAKTLFAYNKIEKIEKTYEAICLGKLKAKTCIIKPIHTENINGINTIKRTISPLGKDAVTYVEPIKYNNKLSHIRLKLKNGRTHQIRVHLSSINHSLVGDCIYGEKSDLIAHTALICKEISFTHPKTRKKMVFSANYENDFKNLLNQIS